MDEPPLPESFWSFPGVVRLLRTCDVPSIVSAVRRARGWSQAGMGRTIGYSQAWVSKLEAGRQPVTLDQAREILQRLGAPLATVSLGEQVLGGDDATNRRDALRSAALVGVALPALGSVGAGDLDDITPTALRGVTRSQRRLDATVPSRELADSVNAHFRLARHLARRCRSDRQASLSAAASEAAGFAAWLHFDMHDLGTARRYYRAAVAHALDTGHRLLTGYMLGSLGSLEVETGDPTSGLALMHQAADHLGPAPHPTAVAWLSSVRAVGYATEGKTADTERCLRQADDACRAQQGEAPWPWVFPFDSAKVAGYRALCAVRSARPDEAVSLFAEVRFPRSPKQAALMQLECADANLRLNRLDEGFHLARSALTTGQNAQSERVIRRAGLLRQSYSGPPSAAVRAFDTQLRQAAL